MIRLHRCVERTRAEGPGQRFALWVQGCRHACPGCYAKALWDEEGGELLGLEELKERLSIAAPGLEGITLLGGEPFLQAEPLAEFAAFAQSLGLSVICFTGGIYEQLLASDEPGVKQLIACTDVLIDGPYIQQRRDFSRPLVGSGNQRFLFLTQRYSMEDILAAPNRLELCIDAKGVLRANGMGQLDALDALINTVKGE